MVSSSKMIKCSVKCTCLSPIKCKESNEMVRNLLSNDRAVHALSNHKISDKNNVLQLELLASLSEAELVVRDLTTARVLVARKLLLTSILEDTNNITHRTTITDALKSAILLGTDLPQMINLVI